MIAKSKCKKIMCLMFAVCLLMPTVMIPVLAEDIHPKITTTVTIEDLETGEIETFEIDDIETTEEIDDEGRLVTTATVDVGDSEIIAARGGQSNNNTFSGWKGTASIKFTDDGTYANLTNATGNWTKVSGSSSISAMSMTYGQDLMTNARNGSIGLSSNSTTSVSPNWPAGKYAYSRGNRVGTTIFATIAGKKYSVACNYGW